MTPYLHYFKAHEFKRGGEQWLVDMSPRLLVMLDSLRNMWRKPIMISKDPGAIGRFMGESLSQHNITKWGEVRAVDVLPDGVITRDDANRFLMLATDVGFTGIGLYLDWASGVGFHLDVRIDRKPGSPATWGRVSSEAGPRYVTLDEALERFR